MSVDISVNNMIRMVTTQLDNLQSMVANQVPLIEQSLNEETDDYNQLVDALEQKEEEVLALSSRLNVLETERDDNELARLEAEGKYKKVDGSFKVLELEVERLRKQLKALQALQPEKIEKKNRELSKENREQRDMVRKLGAEIKQFRKESAQSKIKHGEMASVLADASKEIESIREKLNYYEGKVEPERFHGKNGTEFFINVYEWGLTIAPAGATSFKLLKGLDWHIEVKTNFGVNVTTGVTDWFQAFFPRCQEFNDCFAVELYAAIEELVFERCKNSHPHLTERYLWARETTLDSLPCFSDKQKKLLAQLPDDKVITVVTSRNDMLARNIKGLSEKGAQEIIDTLNNYVDGEFPKCR